MGDSGAIEFILSRLFITGAAHAQDTRRAPESCESASVCAFQKLCGERLGGVTEMHGMLLRVGDDEQ